MNRNDDPSDELLDRAARAMADAPEMGEFSEERALEFVRVEAARRGAPVRSHWLVDRIKHTRTLSKLAASFFVGVCLLGVAWALFHAGPVLAFSLVVQQLHDARTMTADVLIQQSGIGLAGRMMFAAPGRLRAEFADEPTQIVDLQTGRIVIIDHRRKTATTMQIDARNMAANPAAASVELLDKLRNLSRDAGQALGEAEVNGVRARQFNVIVDGQQFMIWANAKTGAPLRIETDIKSGNDLVKITVDHLVLGQPLDEALFSTAIPEGYK